MLKRPMTFAEQVQKLKDHHILIDDEAAAISFLSECNYYRISGYALSFRKAPDVSDCIEGTTFDTLSKLYLFDRSLRRLILSYLEPIETYYKNQIAYHFALFKCADPPHDQHYDVKNYYRKTDFRNIISNFERERDNYYKDSLIVKHHREKYAGQMPLWVMMDLLSFSNASKLYSCMYQADQDAISHSLGIGSRTLSNHLHCLSVLRNRCAHAGRLYNTKLYPRVRFTKLFLRQHPEISTDSLFAYIIMLLKRLPNREQKSSLASDMCELVDNNKDVLDMGLIGFPNNYELILNNNI